MEFDSFDEYNDPDATSCALGDYNAFEEREVFNDHEDREPDFCMDLDDETVFFCRDDEAEAFEDRWSD